MTYHANKKAKKLWSDQAIAAEARLRIAAGDDIGFRPEFIFIDHYMKITIERRATGETAIFECFEGDRIDNYRVYCNNKFIGVQSITTLTKNIRKAIPRFRRMD